MIADISKNVPLRSGNCLQCFGFSDFTFYWGLCLFRWCWGVECANSVTTRKDNHVFKQRARENLHTGDSCFRGSPRTSKCVSMRMYTTGRSWRSRRWTSVFWMTRHWLHPSMRRTWRTEVVSNSWFNCLFFPETCQYYQDRQHHHRPHHHHSQTTTKSFINTSPICNWSSPGWCHGLGGCPQGCWCCCG